MNLLKRSMLLLPILAAACSSSGGDDGVSGEEDLTSISARSRSLRFTGVVYVADGASQESILQTVRAQTQTAFGALRTSEMAVNSRELKEVDARTFRTRKVTAVDPSRPGDAGKPMLEVRYTYRDMAVVPVSMATRSSVALALMGPNYRAQTQRILRECTPNDKHAQEFSSTIWYVFEPSLSQCQTAMRAEQDKIDADRQKLTDKKNQVALSEVERLYLPMTAFLGSDRTNRGDSFPEYDRLYRGGVVPGKLVVSMVNGLIDHETHANVTDDSGFGEWIDTLKEVMDEHPGKFKLVKTEPEVDLFHYTVGSKQVTLTFDDIIKWKAEFGSLGQGLSFDEQKQLAGELGARVNQKWLTFEMPVKVTIGDEPERDVGVQILTFFGSGSGTGPFKHAIKNSDVFLYNGHSFIGFGPLDPRNFTKADFPASYQILFIDGCVSYNYYHKDYIPLKEGGIANLDLVTNGLEAPSFRSGFALGRFIATLINGKQESYISLLRSADDTDALRVVDGELGNKYKPSVTPIRVR
jgi:hypothetical protein